ncbi:thioredoxin family protein [Microseira sp. BLCC-F43]|jgi:thioredoxin 1|uniref:thioredoxin family protein n=1 Tax=Microseira sp. BLCC-F43 TaxID=3153602 RepID=UPI0035BAAC14
MVLSVTERTFTQEVLESPIPVLVHFWAPWCGLCHLINPQLQKFQPQWGPNVKLVGINADSNFKLANAYHLTSLPTLILFEDGQILHRQENFRGRDDVWQALQSISLTCATSRVRSRQYQTHSA